MSKLFTVDLSHFFTPIALIFAVLIFMFRNNSKLQIEVVALACLFYLTMAFIHHHFDKSLTFEIIVEYILIAALSLIILQQFLI